MLVAICMVAVMAMLVLVIDVGQLLLSRRAMVNAADASALAAAYSCGQREGLPAANDQVVKYAVDNLSTAAVRSGYPRYTPNCDAPSGTVTVQLRSEQALAFAAVLGFDDRSDVVTEATARWGPTGSLAHVAPLMISGSRLSTCEIPPPPGESVFPKTCAFWWDNSPHSQTDGALSNAEWGTLDLLNWNVTTTTHCNNSSPPQFEEWMFEGFSGPLDINQPGPTYVCRGQGNFGAALDKDLKDARDQGIQLLFPVNNPPTQVDSSGIACPPGSTGCMPDKYDIIGFASMVIENVYKGNSAEAYTYCISQIPGASASPNARCMIARWDSYSNEGANPLGGANFGVVSVKLIG